jgi:hypothetical protein
MAKGRDKKGREVKKPKADKKVIAPPASFLRPQPGGTAIKPKEGHK